MNPHLVQNSSHSPGCIRALPASQSCQVRRVENISPAAAVCDRQAALRACLISDGAGLFIVTANDALNRVEQGHCVGTVVFRNASEVAAHNPEFCTVPVNVSKRCFSKERSDICNFFIGHFMRYLDCGHDLLRLLGRLIASHELNYTRNPRNSKYYFGVSK